MMRSCLKKKVLTANAHMGHDVIEECCAATVLPHQKEKKVLPHQKEKKVA